MFKFQTPEPQNSNSYKVPPQGDEKKNASESENEFKIPGNIYSDIPEYGQEADETITPIREPQIYLVCN